MDLSVPIIGLLAYLGYNLNDKKTPREVKKKRQNISPHEKPSGDNVYSSKMSKEIDAKEKKLAAVAFSKSKDPKNTNIIPPLYNSYSQWDEDTKSKEIKVLPRFQPETKEVVVSRDKQILSGPMFQEGSFVSFEQAPSNFLKESFENTSELSGAPLDLRHNNMTPFFGSNVTQNTRLDQNESRLYYNTGVGENYQSKVEVEKMFKEQQENVFGSRPLGETISPNRYVQSNLKTNLLPSPQERIKPLREVCVRPSFKSVDQLRVENNPKVSFKARSVKGKHFVTTRGVASKMDKNRPDTYYKNGPERYFTDVSHIKAPKSRSGLSQSFKVGAKVDVTETALNVSSAYNPGLSSGKREYVKVSSGDRTGNVTLVEDDIRQTYEADWVRNSKYEINSHNYLDRDGYTAYDQERDTTNRMTILPANDASRGYRQALPDEARTTHKEANLFSYNGVAAQPSRGNYDTTQYDNAFVFSTREELDDLRGYSAGPQKENIPLGSGGVNIHQRNDDIRQNKYLACVGGFPETSNAMNIGDFENTSNKEATEHDFKDRIDNVILEAFNKNPYTQRLDSY